MWKTHSASAMMESAWDDRNTHIKGIKTMYSNPNLSDPTDRLAHMLSEMHNDNAPMGWERYRSLASLLMMKLPIKHMVMDERFLDHNFQPGKDDT